MTIRAPINTFELANPLYKNASVSFFTVTGGVKTFILATLYASPTGNARLPNPQKLTSKGQFKQPVYIQDQVIGSITGLSVPSHDTSAYSPFPTFMVNQTTGKFEYSYDGATFFDSGDSIFFDRGPWVTGRFYNRNDIVENGNFTYRIVVAHLSGVFATDLAAGKLAVLVNVDSSGLPWSQAGTGAVPRFAQDKMRESISVLDYGVVPGNPGASVTNWQAIVKLIATVANGGDPNFQWQGHLLFPAIYPCTTTTKYYIGGVCPFRDGIMVDLCGSTLHFNKAESTLENGAGFIYARRDFALENGYIEVDYTASVGNRGNAIKLNARYSDADQAPGNYFLNNFEEDQAPGGTVMPWMPGNITLRNLRIKSNNPLAAVIQMVGGLKNLVFENIEIDGQMLSNNAIDYEFGGATDEALNENEKSSHGCNFYFRNIEIRNYTAAPQMGVAVGIRGAYNVTIDGLYCKDVKQVMDIGLGEAANFRPGTYDTAGVKRNNFFRNIVGQGVTGSGISIYGSYPGGGFLDPVMKAQTFANAEQQSTDLIDAVVENFTLVGTAGGNGCSVNGGKITLRNGRISGFNNNIVDSGVRNLLVERVDWFDASSTGMRINNSGVIYASGWTDKRVVIRGCDIAGSTGAGISLESGIANMIIEGNNFGYDNRATGMFTWTKAGGTLTSLKVNAVEILAGPGTPVVWAVSDANTTDLIIAAINTYTATSGYSATFEGNQILIRAASGTGTTPNGFVVLPAGTMTFSGIMNMSGGKFETTQTASIAVAADVAALANKKQVIVRNNLTRAATSVAYANQDTAALDCLLQGNRGLMTTSGAWAFEGMAVDTNTNLADKTKAINTANKFYGRQCYNSSTNKLFVAIGPAATDNWVSVDGGTTATPS